MKILHITDLVNSNGNGVAVAVSYYVKYEKYKADVAVYNLNSSFECEIDNIYTKYVYSDISLLPNGFNRPDIVIFNEVYKRNYLKIYKYCLKNNIPYIIVPHGCLVAVAQKKKKMKKFLGNLLFFNRFIKKSSAIQFLNISEKNDTYFKYSNYIISGNGVDEFLNKEKVKITGKDLIYIGRYSIYHKGLDMLVKVCSNNASWFRNNKVKVQLYGRTSGNDLKKLEKIVEFNKIDDILIINGPVYKDDKRNILNKAYGFIQISRHEGQPMGIVEALALGIPCIVTSGTTFAEFVNHNNCGIGVSFDEIEIFDAIKKIYSSNDIRNSYSINAIDATKKYFSWDKIISKLLDDYELIIMNNGGR